MTTILVCDVCGHEIKIVQCVDGSYFERQRRKLIEPTRTIKDFEDIQTILTKNGDVCDKCAGKVAAK
jgi:hypothetical protein